MSTIRFFCLLALFACAGTPPSLSGKSGGFGWRGLGASAVSTPTTPTPTPTRRAQPSAVTLRPEERDELRLQRLEHVPYEVEVSYPEAPDELCPGY